MGICTIQYTTRLIQVGVQVSRARYFASQPWPFPHSLMIAFVCDWAGGALRPQAGEIEAEVEIKPVVDPATGIAITQEAYS